MVYPPYHPPYPVPQTDPPRSPRETLPTMYDLPSENPDEPGLPDEFHGLQPQLLTRSFRCHRYPPNQIFIGSDINLYYDVRYSQWYKRPDWFLVVGIPRLYDEVDLRSSYVVWQEGTNPFVVVELLSPGTEKEDLGEWAEIESIAEGEERLSEAASDPQGNGQSIKKAPPRKWTVYEQILRIPYYFVFNRRTDRLRVFKLVGGHYQEQELNPTQPRFWIAELNLGVGLWQGEFEGIDRLWLRWYDDLGNWVPTDTELEQQRAEQERQRAEQERLRAEQAEAELANLRERLRSAGIDPETL
ncbi:Uma2 family endonuclease [Egbenema bharatensis]|uniref:Uma2 family endonuclease n=1 Tax=Egbenema bharatensis TaxID=3463334 RepID=UPI003A8B5EA5